MEAASMVRYWCPQLTALRNSIGISPSTIKFAKKHSLPTKSQPFLDANKALHGSWAGLRSVQMEAYANITAWLHEMVEEAAEVMNTMKEVARKQMTT